MGSGSDLAFGIVHTDGEDQSSPVDLRELCLADNGHPYRCRRRMGHVKMGAYCRCADIEIRCNAERSCLLDQCDHGRCGENGKVPATQRNGCVVLGDLDRLRTLDSRAQHTWMMESAYLVGCRGPLLNIFTKKQDRFSCPSDIVLLQ